MPELDSLRGIAILGVLFLHGFYWPYSSLHLSRAGTLFLRVTQPGWLGVNLFFVLSGFLITGILLDSRNRPDYYRRFYGRRALRILPAYYLLLLLLGLLGQAGAAYLGLSFIYLANVTNLFGVANDYGPLWSLAVEEHYYILWPTLVRRLSLTRVAAVASAIFVGAPALRAVAFHFGFTSGLASYTWFVCDGLAAGSLLAILLRAGIDREKITQVACLLIAISLCVGVIGAPYGILTRNSVLGAALQHTVISILFAGMLLASLLLGTSRYQRWINRPILHFFGYISYGLYLIHLMVFRLYDTLARKVAPSLLPSDHHFDLIVMRFFVAGGAAVAVAYISRKTFEQRFLDMKRLLESRK
jgi:peptidoglycan/LPS O-acetylase OafA/YrhL